MGHAHIKLVSKDQTVEKKVHLDADQIRSITNAIEEQDLTVLEKKYENEFVTGGMCYNLLVEYHKKSTVVNVSNVPVPEVQKIGKAVTDALTAAEPGWDKFT